MCGAVSEADYAGLWLQCDACAAWQHAACLGLSRAPAGDALQRCVRMAASWAAAEGTLCYKHFFGLKPSAAASVENLLSARCAGILQLSSSSNSSI